MCKWTGVKSFRFRSFVYHCGKAIIKYANKYGKCKVFNVTSNFRVVLNDYKLWYMTKFVHPKKPKRKKMQYEKNQIKKDYATKRKIK